jgi:hypothetical protein
VFNPTDSRRDAIRIVALTKAHRGVRQAVMYAVELNADPRREIPFRQVAGEAGNQPFAVTGSPLAILLGFDDPTADLPLAGRHQRIDAASRCMACSIEQFHDTAADIGIVGRQGGAFLRRCSKESLCTRYYLVSDRSDTLSQGMGFRGRSSRSS